MEIDRKLADLAASHHGIFSGRHLDQLGISRGERRRRFEDGSWIRIHDGAFRIAGAPLTSRGELLAACWAGGDRAVASHRSAASLWGLPGGSNAITEITCPRWRRSRHEGLIVHESTLLTSADMTEVDRIPCTSVERTMFDMCGTGGAALADLLLDSALHRRLTTISRLVAARDRLSRRGRRGAAHFRAAVDRRDPSAALPESAPERMIARFIERNGLPAPVHQYVVKDRSHGFVARVDLAYPEHGLVIEYDSTEHHSGLVALERDSARRNALVGLGLIVLTATPADVRDRAHRLSAQIRSLLRPAHLP